MRGRRSWAISDRSGFKVRYKDLREDWNGSWVHYSELDGKHPRENIAKPRPDGLPLPHARPDQEETDPDIDAEDYPWNDRDDNGFFV